MIASKRLPQLDFLRGIAVILVLFRHCWISDALQNVGWIGVDLFFVLSGFLVSGLLFDEYKNHGDIKPFRFLIRRGFKIYPLFYLSLLITFIFFSFEPTFQSLNWKGKLILFAPEIFFLQNYLWFIWIHHWSLAVEEHFYLLLTLFFPIVVKQIRFVAPVVFIGCLAMRFVHPDMFQTHLRLDSLFAGVCVAYIYHFSDLRRFHDKYRPVLIALTLIPFCFIFTDPLNSYWTQTIGLSLLYISFSSLLILALYSKYEGIPLIVNIGYYSYGIYLFHLYLMRWVIGEQPHVYSWTVAANFAFYFVGSILLGVLMSKIVEKPFLRLRSKLVPTRRLL